ncbi:MAG TPA: amidohydrolase family protein [Acetobacteraceae bacterium]|nr:amidohydrolase family protein [Acetobacteraceae bacterium]
MSAALPRRPSGGPIIDIHAHVLAPEAARLAAANNPPREPMEFFSSDATRAVNRQQAQDVREKYTMARLADMDRQGVDIQVVAPPPGQFYYWAAPDLGAELSRRVNDHLAGFAAGRPDRFRAFGTIPMQAPALAVKELERCATVHGMRGIELCTNVNGRDYSAPEFHDVFAAAEQHDLLLFLHPAGFTGGERLTEHYMSNVLGNPIECTLAIAHLILGGVLDRHPALKVYVAHGGGYLPFHAGRMEHAWHARADVRGGSRHPPSHYLRRNFWWDTVVFDPRSLRHLMDVYGADRVLLGTDFPFDMGEEDPISLFHRAGNITREEAEGVLGGNAEALLAPRA